MVLGEGVSLVELLLYLDMGCLRGSAVGHSGKHAPAVWLMPSI